MTALSTSALATELAIGRVGNLLFEFTICGAGSVCGADATAVVETA